MCCLKDLIKIHQNLTFANSILQEFEKINYPSMAQFIPTLFKTSTFQNQKVFKPIATGIVRDENINFELDRTSSTSEKIQTKQFLLSSKVSSSHQVPSYQTYTTSKSNEYINELTLPYFGLFCQTFHIPFDQLFFVVMKNFFNRYIKRLLKSRNYWFLIYRILHYFPMFSKNSIS